LRFGVMAAKCEDEREYIENSIKLINYLRHADKRSLSDVFFGKIPNIESLYNALDKISKNITKVQAIPINKRHFDF
jgi:hypothetical protein